ncbi:c-type cytochrome [Mariluticola halotolerans]|uniref:c-type cytochrome n=1 Tax=Mariluticola halotolerans TaxID=2909283 RepID=UPI0026E2A501|nr:cytochrome c family protein [Mariluticola halotolerans]UJQ93155.1 cytochrome c family protein [Mariluticola halotolerans]
MDSFELNKIIGAILGTLLFVMGVGFVAEAIYAPIEDNGAGYTLAEAEGAGHGGGEEVVEEKTPLGVLLASADPAKGESVAKKCASCHNFEAGAANKTGPGLYGVVGHPIASHDGFAYSDALASLGAEGETWTYENLDAFLTSPKAFAPGTKMTFAGLRRDNERADLLAYLQTLSDAPVAFPEPPAEETALEEIVDNEGGDAEMQAEEEAAPSDAAVEEATEAAPAH